MRFIVISASTSRRCWSFARQLAVQGLTRKWLSSQAGSRSSIEQLLAEPTWSVSSLLPKQDATDALPKVSSQQLHHLLRLSALPPPKDQADEDEMLGTLSSQLHFVREVQNVDTSGVEPLRSLRDETAAGKKEAELGLEALTNALAQEEVVGQYHKRIRRKRGLETPTQHEKWDVLGNAAKMVGRFFVVQGGKD